jgi:hypothetical protein
MSEGMSDGIITDIEDAIKGDVPAWFVDAFGMAVAIGPKLFVELAGVEADPLISIPYVRRLMALLGTLFEDLAARKPEADAKAAFDAAAADMIEDLRFGPR